MQAGEAERDIHQAASDDKGLRKVGNIYHIFFETVNGCPREREPYPFVRVFGVYAQAGENLRTAAVTLITVGEQSEQLYRFLFIPFR